jgi:hypothetical protein
MAIRRSGASRRSRTALAGVGVVVLAIVVMGLSFLALTQNRSVASAGSTPGASEPQAGATAAPAEVAAPAPVIEPVAAVPNRVIAAISAEAAVRAIAANCPTPSTIESTGDAGATWEPFEAAGVSAVQRITAGSDAFVALIGLATEGCTPIYERSFTGGTAWEAAPDELAASWFVDPANRAGLHAPAGDRAAPCTAVVQLAVVDENSAAVLCDDGSVHATRDAGANWLPPATVAGAAAISVGPDGYRAAVVNQNACVGAQVVGIGIAEAGLVPGAAGTCLAATVSPGETAVASAENVTWLWAGDGLARSADGGATWL